MGSHPTSPNVIANPPRGRPAAGAVSRPMPGDLHPWQPPWPHGRHVAPGPRQGRRGLGAVVATPEARPNAADQVHERQAGDGRDLAGQLEAALGHRGWSRGSASSWTRPEPRAPSRSPAPRWSPLTEPVSYVDAGRSGLHCRVSQRSRIRGRLIFRPMTSWGSN